MELETPHGIARAHVHATRAPRGALVLGHGAGGGVGAPDLLAVTRAAVAAGVSVALVEQPYRVAGRRSPAPARQLDAAWVTVIEQLRAVVLADLPLVTGGRSSGARVACRTAGATRAVGVVCLAFPLMAPSGTSRQAELDGAGVPILVVQGEKDRFGRPAPEAAAQREVVVVGGDHGLKRDLDLIGAAVGEWLSSRLRVGGSKSRPR